MLTNVLNAPAFTQFKRQSGDDMTKQEKIEAQEQKPAHNTIAAALTAAQAEMDRAKKDANNPHFKSKYADLDSVCTACMPALNKHGIAVVQPMEKLGDEWVLVTRFIHSASGETLETPVPIIQAKHDMQGLGSAMTYARRYGLMALAGIAPEDDDGNAAAEAAKKAADEKAKRDEQARTKAAAEACAYITDAATLDDLRQAWSNLPKDMQRLPAVIEAKDARKAALEKAAQGAKHPPIDDEIPH
jgi:hypothetical protein